MRAQVQDRPHPLEGEGDHEKSTNVGLGLSPPAQAHIRSARKLTDEMGWPNVEPDLGFVELAADGPLAVRTEKTHVVYTRGADGQARLYIDGEEAAAAKIGGDLSAWDTQVRLALGNELGGDRVTHVDGQALCTQRPKQNLWQIVRKHTASREHGAEIHVVVERDSRTLEFLIAPVG